MRYFAFSIPGNGGHPLQILPAGGIPTGGDSATFVIQNVVRWGVTFLFVIATLLALAFLIWGGISWITSGGSKEGIDAARKKITYAIIGLVVALLAFFIINTIGDLFGVNLLNPSCKVGQHKACSGPHNQCICVPN